MKLFLSIIALSFSISLFAADVSTTFRAVELVTGDGSINRPFILNDILGNQIRFICGAIQEVHILTLDGAKVKRMDIPKEGFDCSDIVKHLEKLDGRPGKYVDLVFDVANNKLLEAEISFSLMYEDSSVFDSLIHPIKPEDVIIKKARTSGNGASPQ